MYSIINIMYPDYTFMHSFYNKIIFQLKISIESELRA